MSEKKRTYEGEVDRQTERVGEEGKRGIKGRVAEEVKGGIR